MAVINGTAGNDTIPGTPADDTINGLAGNDTIDGGAGNDSISGGTGNDLLLGGPHGLLALGLDPTKSLVISQVVLSFGIPFALVPLVLLTRRADVMGTLVNRRGTTIAASVVAAAIIALNVFLVVETVAG